MHEAAGCSHQSWYSKLEWAHQRRLRGLDIVEFPLNVNGKSCWQHMRAAQGEMPASIRRITTE